MSCLKTKFLFFKLEHIVFTKNLNILKFAAVSSSTEHDIVLDFITNITHKKQNKCHINRNPT